MKIKTTHVTSKDALINRLLNAQEEKNIFNAATRLADRILDMISDDEDIKEDTMNICDRLGYEFGSDEFMEIYDNIFKKAIKQL